MKKKILNITLLGLMLFSISFTANAKSKSNRYQNTAGRKNSNKQYVAATASTKKNGYIGVNKAISIALKKVKGAKNSNVTDVHLDREKGRMVYEGEIHYNGMEYEFDIDATTGEIVKWKVDRD